MKHFLLPTLTTCLLLTACKRDKIRTLHFETVTGLVIADSSERQGKLMAYDKDHRWGLYPIYYIGPKTDTVGLGRETVQARWVDDWRDTCMNCAKWWTDTTITLRVYTDIKTTHAILYENYDDRAFLVKKIDSLVTYAYNLIVIENISDSLIFLGESHLLLNTVLQAKDTSEKWIDIESPITPRCGTGLRNNYLEGGEILIAKMIRHTGNYKATCRLKFGRANRFIYSNEFEYLIDKRQLTDTLPEY